MTPREHQTLVFIETHIAEAGYAPTLGEIADHLGLASRSGAHKPLTSLERQGRITRDRDRPRAITVLIGTAATPAATLATFSTEALRTELTRRQEADHG